MLLDCCFGGVAAGGGWSSFFRGARLVDFDVVDGNAGGNIVWRDDGELPDDLAGFEWESMEATAWLFGGSDTGVFDGIGGVARGAVGCHVGDIGCVVGHCGTAAFVVIVVVVRAL